jgi:hypothetical protein
VSATPIAIQGLSNETGQQAKTGDWIMDDVYERGGFAGSECWPGIAMGIQQNFTPAPAHAHLNLIGGVRLVPVRALSAAGSGSAYIHTGEGPRAGSM